MESPQFLSPTRGENPINGSASPTGDGQNLGARDGEMASRPLFGAELIPDSDQATLDAAPPTSTISSGETSSLRAVDSEITTPNRSDGESSSETAGKGNSDTEADGIEEEETENEELDEPATEEKPVGTRAKAVLTPTDPTKVDAANFDALFAQWKASGDPRLRERLILSQRSMVIYLARRFMDRGELFEDVLQIGMVGLINALDGFDSTRGIRFSTFAIPSISGEIRRYFRDKMWGMRVPRRMQELYAQIQNRVEEMTQRLDRSPTYAEIAIELGVEVEEVVETLELGSALDPQSLDDPVFGEEGTSVTDTVGGLDPDLEAYEEHASLQMALSRLTEKERRVLELAYFEGHSQTDIARQMGVSQMHISRLLRRSLTQLRHLLEEI